ncbi:CTP synthase protein [Tanticharoenia sakaeratensis NBRC 103193]|uniref:CTP synthase (glutamine hydrolyzing) n=2 Tax=Tanticharoenia TaxID=444052 RepID=A0A0D6MKH5_9PROT|nr:CTP synthase protein [Tanticharoenia sakaeratensis NBRC 103193]GBQ23573.1 CTP synthase [Tanticharoenia sakaeratensis NBRC 103193]
MTLLLVCSTGIESGYMAAPAAAYAAGGGADVAISQYVESAAEPVTRDFPTADGALVGSSYLWVDRLCGDGAAARPMCDDEIIAAAGQARDLVVAYPEHMSDWARAVGHQARALAVPVRHAESRFAGNELMLSVDEEAERCVARRDRYGRIMTQSGPGQAEHRRDLRICLVGQPRHHQAVNPATVAALADAADALDVALDLRFLDAADSSPDSVSELLTWCDGVVLPGGDVANAPLQMIVARKALDLDKPTVGLCLGMQSMVTVFAQVRMGLRDMTLAELDPQAPVFSFESMTHPDGTSVRKLGKNKLHCVETSDLGRALGTQPFVRLNHRYRLAPTLVPSLQAAGLVVAADSADDGVIQAVELPSSRFFCGMQGHPECTSSRGQPHVLLTRFFEKAGQQPERIGS